MSGLHMTPVQGAIAVGGLALGIALCLGTPTMRRWGGAVLLLTAAVTTVMVGAVPLIASHIGQFTQGR